MQGPVYEGETNYKCFFLFRTQGADLMGLIVSFPK